MDDLGLCQTCAHRTCDNGPQPRAECKLDDGKIACFDYTTELKDGQFLKLGHQVRFADGRVVALFSPEDIHL